MAIRCLKVLLVALVGLQAWLYVAGNTANWESLTGAVGYVVGMEEHFVYPVHIFPAITSPAGVVVCVLIILSGEFLVGALCLKGAWDLWRVRNADAASFNHAKTFAVLGTGMAVVVWFGGFIVVGGALFQMWQTEIGSGSFRDALVYAATGGLILLFVNQPDT